MNTKCFAMLGLWLLASVSVVAQEAPTSTNERMAQAVAGLQLRGIGPAVMGGRIADVAVHPTKRSTWYVAVGSGGVWKTINAGITWQPIFDTQASYSIGAVALDPHNPDVVWVGTGENVSGRHVGWGDGVYKSRDGGQTWQNMGLTQSQHIAKILIDRRDSQVVFVAAEGPLWSSGGERGLYKSTDGGTTWQAVLAINENTGVTDVEFDPVNPEVMYAAAYQRRRHIWSLLAGGPDSGLYKSTDGGDTWRRLHRGLPKGDMGKIGLAVTPADPERVYATIEAHPEERGFYRSDDKGESWAHQNPYLSNGTGPHYYQEIEASPHDPDVVYQMDVFLHITRDGGTTFDYHGTGHEKHSDNHALWIDPDDALHLLVGTDAGLYETFDDGKTWRHFPNMPISQFYKLALDNSEPFYHILGGAQDLGTLFGPARTMNVEGVRNRDWYVPMGADGYGVAFDPNEPNIFYLETQVGNLYRYDRRSEEALNIQPQPAPGDPPERWNWDAPILISPHAPHRLYFGSQRLWKSEDRGQAWTPISADLTRNQNRYTLEMMGRVQSIDALYDNGAMSQYSTLTSISESPLQEGLLYVSSDDGLIQVSENGGANWRVAADLPGLPAQSFMNEVEAARDVERGVFAVASAHKTGDFSPYVFESTDGGRSWRSIAGDLPTGTIIWAIEQDHADPDLLFLGTEFGVYASVNRGTNWLKLSGAPTISFRDLEIHRRDEDLVGATFGRGFYVLDDYTPLRYLTQAVRDETATLFPVRSAWWYVPNVPMQARGKPTLGSTDFTAPNPPFGAVFTYYLNEVPETAQETRHRAEQALQARNADVPFPGWEQLRAETQDVGAQVLVVVRDDQDRPVRWIQAPARAGVHRVNWDLRLPPPDPVDLTPPGFSPPWVGQPQGPLAAPGVYHAELLLITAAGVQRLGMPQTFTVKPVPTAPSGTDFNAVTAFQQETSALMRDALGLSEEIRLAHDQLRHMRAALQEAPQADPALFLQIQELRNALIEVQTQLNGDRVRGRRNEASVPSILNRIGRVIGGHWETRQMPTATHRTNLEIAQADLARVQGMLHPLLEDTLPQLEQALAAAGAPWTPARRQ